MVTEKSKDWLFQFSPERFDFDKAIKNVGTPHIDWAMNQHRDRISPGDRVFIWQTGQQAQLVAVGHVISPVHEREENPFGPYGVEVAFNDKVDPPLTRSEALANKSLSAFAPFKGAMGTNFPIDDSAIIAELENLLQGRLVPISKQTLGPSIEDSQQAVDAAIKNANFRIAEKVRAHIAQMNANSFEWLAHRLFLKLGYTNVIKTKLVGDGGIDVRATLPAVVGGIQTCIQVKHQQTVGSPVVQSIRGALGIHEIGLLLTSGRFTDEAREEAKIVTKAPIALIDGDLLIKLLLKYEIGVRHHKQTLLALNLEDLTKEQLEVMVEETDEGEL